MFDLVCQIAMGLKTCHNSGVLHRDIKPENIMFGADNIVKFIDFGFAIAQHKKNS